MIARRGYIQFMRLRHKHVLAADCWCRPHVESFRDVNLYRWHVPRASCSGLHTYQAPRPERCPGCGFVAGKT